MDAFRALWVQSTRKVLAVVRVLPQSKHIVSMRAVMRSDSHSQQMQQGCR
jgi:hypothetical protein